LQVHPGFSPDPKPLTDKLRALLKKDLASSQLDGRQAAAISFMGIPAENEPWIFFKVQANTATAALIRIPVSGVFDSTNPESEMFSFSDPNVTPAPQLPQRLQDVSTAQLFPTVAATNFDNPLFPNATNVVLQHFKLRDTMDIVANPQMTTTLTTDCVSCHTERNGKYCIPARNSIPTGCWHLRGCRGCFAQGPLESAELWLGFQLL
jgi:hypothetical protein